MYMPPPETAELLMLAARRLETLKDHTFTFYGIGRTQRRVLILVADKPGITQAQLAWMLKLDRSTVNLLVRKLVATRMVKTEPSRMDRRSRALFTTNMGGICAKAFEEERPYLETVVTHDFSPEECAQFDNFLRRASAVIQHVLDLPPGAEFPPLSPPPFPQRRAL